MRKPKLNKIETMMKTGEEFSLDEKEYAKKTGSTLPKSKYYLEKDSALAKLAKSNGYTVEVIERRVMLKKI